MNARTLTQLGLVVVALVSATTVSGNGTTVDIPLPGTKMQLADTSGPAGRRNFVALRDGDESVAVPDPRVTGATVSIGRVGAGEVTVLNLPASGWSGGPQDFKFKSRSGTVIGARLLAGRSFRFAKGETIHTENSYKYDLAQFAALAASADLAVRAVWTDPARRFSVQYLTRRA